MSALVAELRRTAAARAQHTAEAADRGEQAAAPGADDPLVVYFSSISGNTHRFVQKLRARTLRLPLRTAEEMPAVREPYVLAVPTYGRPGGAGAVPPQVVKFLNIEENRRGLRGVLGAGNTNFGESYCLAAQKIAVKCDVPLLHRFELMGTDQDVADVNEGLMKLWQ
ncbi:class Ib ribonucleoside-diphosphate reductase assembly flavoprotein NrdI [Kocuria palustris]|uniref:class Ib ribonucleoside-diphosphate reductase assembly flavoprotein NrdI n=1 Tax=Kocuria palustris TaxID=71999 RepID=UPI0011A10DE4|nr:class Ib ribonucleoside-diphosphate reductase assembly flavoprotein NrdI [Kocuria palustris]